MAALNKDEEIELIDGLCEDDSGPDDLDQQDFDSDGLYKTKSASLYEIIDLRFPTIIPDETPQWRLSEAALRET